VVVLVPGGESPLVFREGYVNLCVFISTRMGEGAGIGVGGRAGPNGAARVIPLVATAVLWAILSDP
jgi:hypothetical protein